MTKLGPCDPDSAPTPLTETALVKEWEDVRRDDRGFPEGHPDYLRELEERGDRMAAALTAQAAALQEARMQALSDEGQARELSARATTAEAEVERLAVADEQWSERLREIATARNTAEAALETARVALETAIEAHEGIARDCLLRASATGLDGERHIYQQFAALNLERASAIRAALPLPALPKTKGADHD